jgi:osmotically-inducible protein OsmY
MIRLAGLTKPPDVIEVFVRDGQVTLSGRVRDPGIRDTATILAGSVWGIRCLSNEIAIVPVGTSDEQIVAAVSRYLGKAPLGTRQIRVQAADGVVRLTGIVSSDFVRDQAGMIAAAVQGVTAVHNNLVVQGPGESY